MTIEIKHPFISAKGDGGDATVVRPSDWNANHDTSIATNRLVGRLTPGAGPFEEIPISAAVAAALDETTGAAFLSALGLGGFETGDVKWTFKSVASAGWLLMLGGNGTPPSTIGDASSAAVLRAHADCQALFIEIYTTCSDTDAPVSGGRTGNALNDFNAHKTIRIPNLVGRSPIGAGSATDAPPGGGAATTAKVVGRGYGAETATLVTGNLPPYTPAGGVSVAAITLYWRTGIGGATGGQVCDLISSTNSGGVNQVVTFNQSASFTGTPQGGTSTPISIIDNKIALNAMVKL